ncbi:gonadotropin-releasing hormone receptor-like [Folsomia candida]|uniref:gonadotropin-releasing hormone receptor-like n=1 Tax=Folsomia candida TaxID=158441 RepID=UPI001604B9B4|nr:gonadotropin-releasing hormone receptor-like [Folsomia candida]XP_035704292.1 gonadotropin-releasing hormone receptor-like [Folsomia candida]
MPPTFTTTTTDNPLLTAQPFIFPESETELNFSAMFDPAMNISASMAYHNTVNNMSSSPPLPLEFTEMTARSRNEVVAYSILFVVAATGNLTVFFSVCHQLAKLKWRITVLMLHLSIADLIVTFFLMPLEICWRLTIQWMGGELLCKVCQFLRAFGLYLSSNILICISLDRFIAILFPLRMVGATRRVKTMIALAWLAAAVSSAPQCVVFSLQVHPKYPSFRQCVSFGFLSPSQEMAYNVFSVSAMYFLPLIVTVFTYSSILWKISSKSHILIKQTRGGQDQQQRNAHNNESINYSTRGGMTYSTYNNATTTTNHPPPSSQQLLSNSCNNSSDSANLLARAKKRTLRMTFVIVIVFIFCWSPYCVITLWYSFDKEGAKRVDPVVQDALFMMAVANSCLNPIVYGNYTKKTAGSIFNCNWAWSFKFCCCCCWCCCKKHSSRNRRRLSVEDGEERTKKPRSSSLLAITSVI